MAHRFKSKPFTEADTFRQTKSAANAEEIGQSTDEALMNPHMPKFITDAPWYLDKNKNKAQPTLKHQRAKEDTMKVPLDRWYPRGTKRGKKAAKFRKGACENCGAMTHTKKFCVERPRKHNAKFLNKTFGDDEDLQDLDLTFEARIDRWNGFDPEMYNKEVIPEWNKMEQERQKLKAIELEEKLKEKTEKPKNEADELLSDSDLDEKSDNGLGDDIDEDDPDLLKNPRVKSLNKNLRNRQETVKYLQNLGDNDAHYDGKSRAMRENPNTEKDAKEKKTYKGDNVKIYSGQYINLMNQDNFAKEAKDMGNVNINSVAMPSQAELAFKSFQIKKQEMMTDKQKELYEQYGGQEHAEIPDDVKKKALEEQYEMIQNAIKAQSEGRTNLSVKSKYEEDIHKNGHTLIWGSFWHQHFGWGYK